MKTSSVTTVCVSIGRQPQNVGYMSRVDLNPSPHHAFISENITPSCPFYLLSSTPAQTPTPPTPPQVD